MKSLIRFLDDAGKESYGCISKPLHNLDNLFADRCIINSSIYESFEVSETVKVSRLLCPVIPTSIYGIGLNYKAHAAETKQSIPSHPILFMKNISSVIGVNEAIVIPRVASDTPEVDYEVELAVVIGK